MRAPATKSREPTSRASSAALPKSGCSASRPAGNAISAMQRSSVRSLSGRARASIDVTASNVAKRAISAACRLPGSPGSGSQRRAPLASMPKTRVAINSTIPNAQSGSADQRQKESGVRRAMATSKVPALSAARWRTKCGGSGLPIVSGAVVL